MQEANLFIIYNEKNLDSKEFAEPFGRDLAKCLARLGFNATLLQQPPIEYTAHCFAIFSSDDDSTEWIPNQGIKITGITINHTAIINDKVSRFEKYYQFWEKVFETSEILLYRESDTKTKLQYWSKITDIAIEIAEQNSQIAESTKGIVYLSQDDTFQTNERDNIMRDLNDLGFIVVPNTSLSTDIAECTKQINEELEKARLVIHIILPVYNPIFINQHLSLSEHQCNLSACYVKGKTNVKRILWLPSTYEVTDEESLVFIEKIQRDQEQAENSTVLKSTVEELKKHYRHFLMNPIVQDVKSKVSSSTYVLTDEVNNITLNEVRDQLNQLGIDFETNLNGISYNQHLKVLAEAKVVVVCYTAQNEGWLSVKISDILKSRGLDSFQQYEKIILISENDKINAVLQQSIFTHVLKRAHELKNIF